ncbi:protein-methionine-sulfoxide reductase heme-binding subunit MsrQ [Roseicella aerolata]|uniref:Protein-methionine-sulfoxide reductase heme-binding subunit MsrQ n=1 Tax=Roseicella aerolata TaxID=2883479 RepID=A0A9X1IC79_9PROT|nr:ferric reductase-like transmembrane domain-containing protein [Roseicella aerolata]MCB4820370.1 ferric reductase-like transmembrane domain-containing protein [Roseicella aerolata]
MMQAILRSAFPLPAGRPRPFTWPWQDRAGRFSVLRAIVFALLMAPAAWVAAQAALGLLGPEPWKAALKEIGLWTIRLLLLTLAVTPIGKILAEPRILALRRLLGLTTLAYAGLHLALYVGHENFSLWKVASEIALRVYLTIGFVALLGLAVLGWTSSDGWIRQLGPRWKRLHALAFPIAALGVLHFFLQSKSQLWEAVMAAGFLAWLLLWRAMPAGWRVRLPALVALAPLTVLAAAGIEYAWFALATNLPAGRILWANLDVSFGLRPAVWAGVVALAVPLFALAWRLIPLRR